MAEEHVESVYAMLGYPDSDSMQLKARLASKMSEIIRTRGLTQASAAKVIGMPQPKLSNLLRGQFRGVSEAKMMECIAALGSDVEIIITQAPSSRAARVSMRAPRRRAVVAKAAAQD